MKSDFKISGRAIELATSAEMVSYGEGTLKDALDVEENLETSAFGERLLQAQSLQEVQQLLRVHPSEFFDEADGSHWKKVGRPGFTTSYAKFGGSSLRITSDNYLHSDGGITFGGDPFSIGFWARVDSGATYDSWIFRALGTQKSFGLYYKKNRVVENGNDTNKPCVDLYGGTTSANQIAELAYKDWTYVIDTNVWNHFELNYNGTALKYYYNGTLKRTWSKEIPREPRRIYLGPVASYIDSFRILDGICEHTANFTKPSAPYTLTDNTISLLNFN